MTITLLFPALLALIGLLLWVLTAGKLSEAGRIMFACGVLAIAIGQWGGSSGIETSRSSVNRR